MLGFNNGAFIRDLLCGRTILSSLMTQDATSFHRAQLIMYWKMTSRVMRGDNSKMLVMSPLMPRDAVSLSLTIEDSLLCIGK